MNVDNHINSSNPPVDKKGITGRTNHTWFLAFASLEDDSDVDPFSVQENEVGSRIISTPSAPSRCDVRDNSLSNSYIT